MFAGSPGAVFEWTTSDPELATVDANGVVTARKVGAVTIRARSGDKVGSASVGVNAPWTMPGYARITGLVLNADGSVTTNAEAFVTCIGMTAYTVPVDGAASPICISRMITLVTISRGTGWVRVA